MSLLPNWDTRHLVDGEPEPVADPNTVMVYNMRCTETNTIFTTVLPVRFCPFAERTILALLVKKMPFEVVNINLRSKPAWFLANTWGTCSVVRYGGQHVMESIVNSDFIDEVSHFLSLRSLNSRSCTESSY